MKEAGLDAIACSLPQNVLLLTGYFPVVGTAVALMTKDCHVTLLAPEDEMALADCDGADQVIPFQPGSLDELTGVVEAARRPLARALHEQGLKDARVGV